MSDAAAAERCAAQAAPPEGPALSAGLPGGQRGFGFLQEDALILSSPKWWRVHV